MTLNLELFEQRRAIVEYARDRKNRPFGLALVYCANNGELMVGYSKCHKDDRFNRRQGIIQALKRAIPMNQALSFAEDVPSAICPVLKRLIDRARRYFSSPWSRKARKKEPAG